MPLDRFDTQQPGFYSRKDYSPRDAQGYDKRGRKKIGWKKPTPGGVRGFSGLNEYFALQNRATPAFTNPGGNFSAQDMAQQLRREGASAPAVISAAPGQRQAGATVGATTGSIAESATASPLTATMDNLRNINKPGVNTAVSDTVAALGRGESAAPASLRTPEQNRAGLQSMAGEIAARRSFANPSPVSPNPTGPGSILTSKYGTGSSTPVGPGPRKEGLINGRPASEVMQGLANSQARAGTARPDDKYKAQPAMTAADSARLRRSVESRRKA